ncbi:hypothetical protein PISMIDRAFT_475164 [Pisolithus microcarpus 441]|uniref:Uncharacterized protein n=1 Tax=Pisolithus microcarpus 441 TaxID=765257 RepID=A0A0C9Y3Y5_9AGAM|nr:hypothetical protein PISMIDRAFT_475164 [Pisolithus microcarpus 441]
MVGCAYTTAWCCFRYSMAGSERRRLAGVYIGVYDCSHTMNDWLAPLALLHLERVLRASM